MADPMVPDFQPPVVIVHGFKAIEGAQAGIGKPAFDLGAQRGPVVLVGEQIVCAPGADGVGDSGLTPPGAPCAPDLNDGAAKPRGASMVTSAPVSSSRPSSSGIAVISLDFSAQACCPRTSRWRLAQADTMCSGSLPRPRS